MTHLPKLSPPSCLANYIADQQAIGLHPTYNDFREKDTLIEYLHKNQKGICCYCNRKLYKCNNSSSIYSPHIEHLQPRSLFPHLELDYSNLYLSCSDSNTCGIKKKARLIYHLIKQSDCEMHFDYKQDGEITGKTELAKDIILVLNLNYPSLKERRKKNRIRLYKKLQELIKKNKKKDFLLKYNGSFPGLVRNVMLSLQK